MSNLYFKRSITLFFILLISAIAFAQRGGGGGGFGGGGGGFGGGGGGRGGGGNFQGGGGGNFRGGRGGGGWGNYAVLNDSTELERLSGSITFAEGRGAGNAIRDDDLKQLLDSMQFLKYESAQKLFLKGDKQETIGVLIGVPAAILTLIAATHKSEDDPDLSKKLYIISGALAIPALSFYSIGRINRGKAKRAIEQITNDYNRELELKRAAKLLQFEFEPTVFLPNDKSAALGLTVSLNF